jgi:DNA-binding response OmpR family regulator
MMKATILLVEGKRSPRPSFQIGLVKKGYEVYSVPNGNAALQLLDEVQPHVILVDSASMRTNGKRICQSLREKSPKTPIIVVVDQNSKAQEKFEAEVILAEPFTLPKLINRIRTFIPNDKKSTLVVGPMELDVEQHLARCEGKQAKLTPRLSSLLKAFLEKPGEVIDRKELFQQIWETEYLGDTRPLDVHISWLRKKLEEDPRHPRYIKTIRGVGYRLDIEPHTVKKKSSDHKA